MNITEHFTLDEAVSSSTADRLGIDNTPNTVQVASITYAATLMEQVRTLLDNKSIHIDSWFRCEALEKILTRKDYLAWCTNHGYIDGNSSWNLYFNNKAHPRGVALDFTCPQFGTPEEVVDYLATTNIKFDQMIMEGSWIHISFDQRMRMEVKTATFINGTPHYTTRVIKKI